MKPPEWATPEYGENFFLFLRRKKKRKWCVYLSNAATAAAADVAARSACSAIS